MSKKTPVATPAAITVVPVNALSKLVPHMLTVATPEMGGDQIEALAADMKRNGQKFPVTIYEGKVLDGRARVKAAMKVGMPLNTVTLQAGVAPRSYVYSVNVHRRQLTGIQLARVAVGYMQENKAQKLTQEEVADLFGLGAKTLRYVMRVIESGNEGLIKLIENPDTTRGEVRAALVAAGIMPDAVAKGDIGSPDAAEQGILPAPHKSTTQAGSADVDDILGSSKPTAPTTGTVQRATAGSSSTTGTGLAASKAATHRPSAASVTHVATMATLVDTLAKATAQDLEAFYKAAVQRGVWSRLLKVHAAQEAKAATAKAAKSSKATAK